MRKKDKTKTVSRQEVALETSAFGQWQGEARVVSSGAVMLCRSGGARIDINFRSWAIVEGSVVTLFPNDAVRISHATSDFSLTALFYSLDLLREASLQIEPAIFRALRRDCCKVDFKMVRDLTSHMFAILSVYFAQQDCTCLTQLVLLQLKCYFLGYHDYLRRHPLKQPPEMQVGQVRATELFNRFMWALEMDYKECRSVSQYAGRLSITPKHLTFVVRSVTGQSAKEIIDNYVTMQVKLSLRDTTQSLKEIAWNYNFSSLSFFCRFFKKQTGYTPMEYRARQE